MTEALCTKLEQRINVENTDYNNYDMLAEEAWKEHCMSAYAILKALAKEENTHKLILKNLIDEEKNKC